MSELRQFQLQPRANRNRLRFAVVWLVGFASLRALLDTQPIGAESPFTERWRSDGRLNLVGTLSESVADWLYVHPIYRDLYEAGTEVGGNREEFREQNRARRLSYRGMDVSVYTPQWTGGLRLTARTLADYHYYGNNPDRWDDLDRLGEAFAYFRWQPGGSGPADPTPDTSPLLPGRGVPTDSRRRESEPAPGLSMQGGRIPLETDPEGLLYVGEAAGGRLVWTGGADGTGWRGLRLGLSGIQMNREIRAVGRPDYPAALYVAHAGWAEERWTLGLLYAFYRSPGRAAASDLELPGLAPTRVALPTGQSALPDVDVHYYGLRFEQDLSPISYRFSAYYNSGRDIAVDASGTRVGATRRSIRGALGYLEVVYHFGAGHNGAGCLETRPARNSCVRAAAIVDGPELALAGLLGTRDSDDGDDRLRGFGALRPLPTVLGGAASILLSGPPPGRERPALRNSQPGATFADSGLPASQSRYSEGSVFERARDNVDPTPPEYDNEGQTMGSLRLSFVPLEHLEFDLFANYANFRGGDGWEGIVAARLPFQFVDIDFAVQASVTSATYRPFESERNAYTGLLQRPARRFYNRYVLGFVLAL